MPNLKIMVNFEKKKVVHTPEHAGSTAFKNLLSRGYVKVGTLRNNGDCQIYWDSEYFDPSDKYIKPKK